jgi:hypothetical protein
MGLGGHVVTGCTMSTHDETQNTNTTEMSADDDRTMTWMDTNGRGQIVRRPRRFRGLTQREGFADYVEQAYRVAKKLGLLEELAALPSLEDKAVTEIAGLTRTLVWRIRQRMRTFHDGYGPNIYYGALTRMVEAAKEDTGGAAAAAAPAPAPEETNTFVPSPVPAAAAPLPALPTSPLIRQSGGAAAGETMSDSEVELGRAAVRDVLASRIASAATGWTDLSGHPFVGRPGVTGGGPFIRTVSGVGDAVEEEPPRLPAAREDEERDSDEDSASVEDEVTGAEEEDSDEETGGEDADTEGGDDTEPEDEEGGGEQIQHVPVAPAAPLHQNIGLELPMWAWLAILVAFAAWAALVNGVLSRDLGCRLSR